MSSEDLVRLEMMYQRQERMLERLVHLEKLMLINFLATRGERSTQSWIRQSTDLEGFGRDVRKWLAQAEGVLDDDSGSS